MAEKMRERPALSGVLLVDKPSGMTSHTAVSRVRRAFGQREVGHTGTLDPFATGLLVLTLGRATRIARFLEATEKRYRGTVTLGRATTTYDVEGTTTAEAAPEVIAAITPEAIARALESLTGKIRQAVPAFSAVKVDGTRLYSRARRGEEVETPVREVEVFELRATKVALPEIEIEAVVSKGTYIRSLAVQIGEALGVPAHLSALRRTRVGPHDIADAKSLDALQGTPVELLTPAEALAHLPAITLDAARTTDVEHGRPLSAATVLRMAASAPEVAAIAAPSNESDLGGPTRESAGADFGGRADESAGADLGGPTRESAGADPSKPALEGARTHLLGSISHDSTTPRRSGEGRDPWSFREGDPVRLLSPSGELLAIGIALHDRDALPSLPSATRAFSYACVISFRSGAAS